MSKNASTNLKAAERAVRAAVQNFADNPAVYPPEKFAEVEQALEVLACLYVRARNMEAGA